MLLLAKNGSDYLNVVDSINECYQDQEYSFTIVDAEQITFVKNQGKVEMMVQGVTCDGHKPSIKVYVHLGTKYFYNVLHYCVDLCEYEAKPVIFLICEADKDCSVEDIPTWVNDDFEIVRLA